MSGYAFYVMLAGTDAHSLKLLIHYKLQNKTTIFCHFFFIGYHTSIKRDFLYLVAQWHNSYENLKCMVVSKARYHYELINLIILLIQTLQLSSLTDKGNIRCLTSGNLFNLASESFWYNPSCLITSLLLSITKTFQAYLINILLKMAFQDDKSGH